MPETFTFDQATAAAPGSGDSFSFEQALPADGGFSFEDALPPRERKRLKLQAEMAAVRAEPKPSEYFGTAKGALGSIVEGVNKGAGSVVRGLGHLSEILPPTSPGAPPDMPAVKEYVEKIHDPIALKKAIETNPLTQGGKFMQETGEAFAPEEFERDSVVNQALSGAAELAPVMNPAAPVMIGLQGLGGDLEEDFQKLKTAGASDQDAAAGAIKKAEARGVSLAAVWAVLPGPLRSLGEKYLISRVGQDAAKRFLAGRLSTAGEGAVLGAGSKAAENLATGEPVGEGTAKAGLSMATLNLGLPRNGHTIPEGEPGRESGTRVPVSPSEPKPAVTPDLAAELQAAMRGNQLAPEPTTRQVGSAPIAAENSALEGNLIHQAVKDLTGAGNTVKIEIKPASDGKAETKAPESETNGPETPTTEARPESFTAEEAYGEKSGTPLRSEATARQAEGGPPAASPELQPEKAAEPGSDPVKETAQTNSTRPEPTVAPEPEGVKPAAPALVHETPEQFLERHGQPAAGRKASRESGTARIEEHLSEHQDDLARQRSAEEAQPDAPAESGDKIEQWLNKAIKATDPNSGQLMEGVTGLPVWLSKTLAHEALRIAKLIYRRTKDLKAAVNEAIDWVHEQRVKGFDGLELRDWLGSELKRASEGGGATSHSAEAEATTEAPRGEPTTGPERPPKPGERDWKTVKEELRAADEELKAEIHDHSGTKGERAQRIAKATAKYRNLQEELEEHGGHVADLMTRHHQATDPAEKEQLRAELEQTNPRTRERVKKQLERSGVLPKAEPGKPVGGRSIDDLTDWLRQNDIDSPKRTLVERLAIGEKLAARWHGIKDAFDRARTVVSASWRTGIESIKHPPIDTDFRKTFKEWIFYDTFTGSQTKRWMQELKRKVESPLRRMAISVWLDAKGDEGLLRYQLSAIPERWAPVWKKALELTADEQSIARRIRADFEQKLEDSKAAGLMEHGRKDYGVPQVWKKAPEPLTDQSFATKDGPKGSPGNWAATLDPRDPFFSFQRTHPTYFDGIMNGGIPKSLDVADLVGVYNEAFHKALSSRAAIWAMKNGAASDGLPLVKISGSARKVEGTEEGDAGTYFVDTRTRRPSDATADGKPYLKVDHFAMTDWKVANKTADGKTVLVRGDMLVHPEAHDFLKNELLRSALREGKVGQIMKPLFWTNTKLKASKLALGTFHAATIAEHALSHWESPVTHGFEIDLRDPKQALLVRHGLELGLGQSQVAFEEGLASHGGLFEQIPGLGDLSRKFSDWLFKDYIPTLSMKVGLKVLERNQKWYGKELSEGQVAELTAHQMNAAFGLQNYRLLGRNKTILDLERLAMLAPQFLVARAKVFGQAFKPYGMEQRRMLVIQTAVVYATARLLNAWFDDDPHWEFKNAFSLVVNGRAYSLRILVGDLHHALTEPGSFLAGRLSPLRAFIEAITERDMRSGARIKPLVETDIASLRKAEILAVGLAKWLSPVGVEGVLPGAARREQGPVDSALSAVGVGSRKYTSATQVSEWARDFNKASKDPVTRTHQRESDNRVHEESAYRGLNALLDAGKFEEAAIEYQDLQKDGHKKESIANHYRHVNVPFTGSAKREAEFKNSLSEKQQGIYQRAIEERKKRAQAFEEMAKRATAAGN